MRNVLVILIIYLLPVSCKKDIDKTTGEITADISPANPYSWSALSVPHLFVYPFNNDDENNMIVQVNGDVYWLMGSLREVVYKLNISTKRWELFPDPNDYFFPFVVGFQHLFAYQSKIYLGLMPGGDLGNDVYFASRDLVSGQLNMLPNFPGIPVSEPTCFVMGSKGYLIGGVSNQTGRPVNQFWEFNFITNQWTNRGGTALGERAGATAIVYNNYVYVGLGYDKVTNNGYVSNRYKDDWIQFNPAVVGGLAAIKAPFPGMNRAFAKGFVLNNKIYIGWGEGECPQYYNDFWEFNPTNNTWTNKSDCPAANVDHTNIGVFAIGNTGYLVKGWLGEYWRYSNSIFGSN